MTAMVALFGSVKFEIPIRLKSFLPKRCGVVHMVTMTHVHDTRVLLMTKVGVFEVFFHTT